MKLCLEYKGYFGSAEISLEDNVLYGKLLHIKDVISYEGATPDALEHAFREAVNDYLATCEACGDAPDKPFKGTFNVRVSPELHRELAVRAVKLETSLNELTTRAITAYLSDPVAVNHHVSISFSMPEMALDAQSFASSSIHWQELSHVRH